ncbi:MAG: hypothetical protein BZY88_06515 [SAR202 cluster bacterium Io17-Chloro-G9]|nr:MAG: hypothetical protein BZY88_06515 [SAR202 cluster bacterium Io17-Chloro-G9]
MEAFDLTQIVGLHARSGQSYHEFIRSEYLSCGLYCLAAGSVDPQQPHTEDEIYYVIKGSATVSVDGEDRLISEGATIFVAKEVEHRFHTITEGLTILVIFAPPRRSLAAP